MAICSCKVASRWRWIWQCWVRLRPSEAARSLGGRNVLVTVILVKNSTSISYSYTIIFHVVTRSILCLCLYLTGRTAIGPQFIRPHTVSMYTWRNIADFFFFQTTTTESNKKDKKDIHIVITHSRRKKMIEQHDLVTKTTETQLVGRKEFKHLISSYWLNYWLWKCQGTRMSGAESIWEERWSNFEWI